MFGVDIRKLDPETKKMLKLIAKFPDLFNQVKYGDNVTIYSKYLIQYKEFLPKNIFNKSYDFSYTKQRSALVKFGRHCKTKIKHSEIKLEAKKIGLEQKYINQLTVDHFILYPDLFYVYDKFIISRIAGDVLLMDNNLNTCQEKFNELLTIFSKLIPECLIDHMKQIYKILFDQEFIHKS